MTKGSIQTALRVTGYDSVYPNSVVWTTKGIRLLPAALMIGLAGCGAGGTAGDEKANLPQANISSPTGANVSAATDQGDETGRIEINRSDQLVIRGTTRISVATIITPPAQSALQRSGFAQRSYSGIVSDAIVRKVRDAGRPWSIFASPGSITNDGTNIIIEQEISLNRRGAPYRIALTARQGEHQWSASLERPNLRTVAGVPILRDGTTPDGKEYWDPIRDVGRLGARLSEDIIVRERE